jgi:hypothetical protein
LNVRQPTTVEYYMERHPFSYLPDVTSSIIDKLVNANDDKAPLPEMPSQASSDNHSRCASCQAAASADSKTVKEESAHEQPAPKPQVTMTDSSTQADLTDASDMPKSDSTPPLDEDCTMEELVLSWASVLKKVPNLTDRQRNEFQKCIYTMESLVSVSDIASLPAKKLHTMRPAPKPQMFTQPCPRQHMDEHQCAPQPSTTEHGTSKWLHELCQILPEVDDWSRTAEALFAPQLYDYLTTHLPIPSGSYQAKDTSTQTDTVFPAPSLSLTSAGPTTSSTPPSPTRPPLRQENTPASQAKPGFRTLNTKRSGLLPRPALTAQASPQNRRLNTGPGPAAKAPSARTSTESQDDTL